MVSANPRSLPLPRVVFFWGGLFIICKRNPTWFIQVTLPWDMQRLFVKCELFPSPFLSESCGSFARGG